MFVVICMSFVRKGNFSLAVVLLCWFWIQVCVWGAGWKAVPRERNVCGRAALAQSKWPFSLEVGGGSTCFPQHTVWGKGQPRLASLPLIPPGLCCFELGGELPLFRSVFLCLHTVNPISGPGGAPCQVSSANGHGLSFWYSFDDFGGTGQ